MKKTVIVNLYNFIRMSHAEPSVFIQDDFETVKNQMILARQYGFPATWALKYDALMEPRYQELLKACAGERDEISAWWEITEPLCKKAGVRFRGIWTEDYDDRVNSAYSIGYEPEERRRLVDAYMKDFREIFGCYPRTIGSWVLDTATISYAAERYGVVGAAICRDQMGTDGFTLWGGFPNGIYYPSAKNENIPASDSQGQLQVPMFRLLGPDPIYNFEQDVRSGLQGVYTLEPSWLIGRDPKWISWFFGCLTEEDALGVGYAHVGQENNFLWENIKPGMEPQLKELKKLEAEGKIRVETMADSATWFLRTYRLTPPATFQASRDWDEEKSLSAQWYACSNYRVGFLGEEGRLRIRDFFLYRQDYPSRYLNASMTSTKSFFDALPVLFPQLWIRQEKHNDGSRMGSDRHRPYIRLVDERGQEPTGMVHYSARNELTAQAGLWEEESGRLLAEFSMEPDQMLLEGEYGLRFDCLPVFSACDGGQITMEYEGFSYGFLVEEGEIRKAGRDGLEIWPSQSRICLKLGTAVDAESIFAVRKVEVPPMEPVAEPGACIFPAGSQAEIELRAMEPGEIRYTTDGTVPTTRSALYVQPITLHKDTVVSAKLFLADGRESETAVWEYRFGIQGISLTSGTVFDPRPVFRGNGIEDLLDSRRGSLDYLDGRWRGTLQDLEICGQLPEPAAVGMVTVGFLSHHRSGIIYPESIQLFTGLDREHLSLTSEITLPCQPCAREIARQDVSLPVHQTIGYFRLVAHRYERMPQWCCYRGSPGVFTMADNVILSPENADGI